MVRRRRRALIPPWLPRRNWRRAKASLRLLVFSMEDGAGISRQDVGISERRENVKAGETERGSNSRACQNIAKEMHSQDDS